MDPVQGPAKQLMPVATAHLFSDSSGFNQVQTTDINGLYGFDHVPPGRHDVLEVRKSGFEANPYLCPKLIAPGVFESKEALRPIAVMPISRRAEVNRRGLPPGGVRSPKRAIAKLRPAEEICPDLISATRAKRPVESDDGTMYLAPTPPPAPIGTMWGPVSTTLAVSRPQRLKAGAADRAKVHFKKVGRLDVWRLLPENPPNFFFVSGMLIDVDGAPNAYGPPGTDSLDYLANASSNPQHPEKGRWVGIEVDEKRNPKIWTHGPFKGYYISTTSLHDKVGAYVDATRIPYLAIPPKYFEGTGLRLGDYAVVVNSRKGRLCYAIYADSKNLPELGEVSKAVADALGVPSDLKWRLKREKGDKDAQPPGAPGGIVTIVFPGSGSGQGSVPSLQEIQKRAAALFEEWGGIEQVHACFPDLFTVK